MSNLKVYLTAEDEKELLTETLTNIIVQSFDDSTFKITPRSEQVVYQILNNLLVSSRLTLKPRNNSQAMWKRVFWNEEAYRPDNIADKLNEIYTQLQSQDAKQNLIRFKAAEGREFRQTGYSEDEIVKLLREGSDMVQWDGDQFVPKPITLSKINLGKLRNRASFQDKKVRVSYTNAMLSVALNINKEKEEKESIASPLGYEELADQIMGKMLLRINFLHIVEYSFVYFQIYFIEWKEETAAKISGFLNVYFSFIHSSTFHSVFRIRGTFFGN